MYIKISIRCNNFVFGINNPGHFCNKIHYFSIIRKLLTCVKLWDGSLPAFKVEYPDSDSGTLSTVNRKWTL